MERAKVVLKLALNCGRRQEEVTLRQTKAERASSVEIQRFWRWLRSAGWVGRPWRRLLSPFKSMRRLARRRRSFLASPDLRALPLLLASPLALSLGNLLLAAVSLLEGP